MSEQPRPGTLQGIVLLLPITLAVMGIVVLVPVVPQLMRQFAGIPNVQYLVMGGVLTLPALGIALFSPVAGWVADRIGRRKLLVSAMILDALLGASPCLLHNLYAIIATRAAIGVCEAAIMTVSTTMISDYFQGADREKWLANQTAVASVSSLCLIIVGGILGGIVGWRGPFGVYLVGLLLAAAVWRFTWEPVASAGAAQIAAAPIRALAGAADLESEAVEFPLARLSGICAITLIASIMFYTLPTQCSLVLSGLGVEDVPTLGLLTAIACLGVPLGTIIFRATTRLPVAVQLLVEFLLIGSGFALMGRAATASAFVIAAAVNQVGCGMILPTLVTWATRGLRFEMRGRGTGMWQSAFALGQFLCGLVVTGLDERMGGLQRGFVALATTNAVLALAFLAWSLAYRKGRAAAPEMR